MQASVCVLRCAAVGGGGGSAWSAEAVARIGQHKAVEGAIDCREVDSGLRFTAPGAGHGTLCCGTPMAFRNVDRAQRSGLAMPCHAGL